MSWSAPEWVGDSIHIDWTPRMRQPLCMGVGRYCKEEELWVGERGRGGEGYRSLSLMVRDLTGGWEERSASLLGPSALAPTPLGPWKERRGRWIFSFQGISTTCHPSTPSPSLVSTVTRPAAYHLLLILSKIAKIKCRVSRRVMGLTLLKKTPSLPLLYTSGGRETPGN